MTDDLMPVRYDKNGNTFYDPVPVGLHFCGNDGEQPYTALNLPAASHQQARRMWEAARAVEEVQGDDWDYLVDLNLGDRWQVDHVDDFGITRQMAAAVIKAARQAQELMEVELAAQAGRAGRC